MSAKSSIFSIITAAMLTVLSTTAKAQHDTIYVYVTDTVYVNPARVVQTETDVETSGYDKRVHRYRTGWSSLIPTHFKIQYAGNMGFLSAGPGWDYGKRGQWETDLFFGYLPKYETDKAKMTITIKETYNPWSIQFGESSFSFEPLSTGLYLNTVIGEDFWTRQPRRYSSGYYDFESKIRLNIFLGQRFSFDIPDEKRIFDRSITVFYEISSYDMMIVSAIQNSYLKFRDIFTLSFGVKAQIL